MGLSVSKKYNYSIDYLEIEPSCIEEGIAYATKKNYTNIRLKTLNLNAGKKYDLDFSSLSGQQIIKKISINDDFKITKLLNIEALYSLKSLEHFESHQVVNIDFSHLKSLKSLSIKYSDKIKNMDKLEKLEDLLLTSFNKDDLSIISGIKSIISLRISGNLANLNGLDKCEQLKSLKLSYCPKLTDVSAIAFNTVLSELHVEGCKKITDFSFLAESNVEKLFISDIDSLNFIKHMKKIKSIKFWNCKDGNLAHLLENKTLKEAYFYPEKRSYSHKLEEINLLLKEKNNK